VSCYCGACEYPLTLYAPSNPAACDLCHCDSCRAWSGGLFTAAVRGSPPPSALITSGALTGYFTSPGTTRYFCTRCGSHMQVKHGEGEKEWWNVMVGAIKDWGGLKVEVGGHEYVADTKDGGAAEFWGKGTRWAEEQGKSDELPVGWRSDNHQAIAAEDPTGDRLLAQCHCGGVSFFITRPNDGSKSAIPPGWPVQLGPYPLASPHDQSKEHWWLRPLGAEERTQYLAAFCACDTCQRGLGFWAPAWAYVPASNLVTAAGEPVDLSHLGTLKSCNRGDREGVHRDFCGRCGATVFWWRESRGPVIDVALGILRAPEGARAETWFEWVIAGVLRREDGRPENIYGELHDGLR
ncbi:hypothetical protein CALVIDRAFT_457642, partial [Calocera viscosa TUFC12733]